MPDRTLHPLALLLVMTTLACAEAPPEGLSEDALDNIRTTTERWLSAVREGDFDALTELYTVDAVVMPPNQPAVEGRDAIRDWFASGPQLEDVELQILEVDGHEKLAFVRGQYVMRLVPAEGARAVVDTGKYIEVRHRVATGDWLITVDMFSSNRPTP